MNKLFYIGMAIALLLGANSCNKLGSTTITGRLMQSCDTPAANREGYIYLPGGGLFAKANTYIDFTTDENGYFEVSHNRSFSKFSVMTSETFSVLDVNHLEGKKKELGDVYINPFPTNFVIKLDVKNPYTENDTLVMTDFSNPNPLAQKLVAGPFASGVLDSVINSSYNKLPVLLSDISTHGGPKHSVGVYIRSMPDYYTELKYEYFHISPICSNEFAEVTLIID